MGCVLSAGGSLRWFRDTFGGAEASVARVLCRDPYEVMNEEAARVPAGSEGLIFLPYLTGDRTPHADPNARGVFFGITLNSDRAHFIRAVLEGVAYGLRDSFDILAEMGVPISQVRASGGGARSALWRQIQADISGRDHVTVNIDEGPALGVALLAGVGTGLYPSVEKACRSVISVASTTKTDHSTKKIYDKSYPIYRSLYQSLKGDFAKISGVVE